MAAGTCGSTPSISVVGPDVAVPALIRTVLRDVSGWGATGVTDASVARQTCQQIPGDVLSESPHPQGTG